MEKDALKAETIAKLEKLADGSRVNISLSSDRETSVRLGVSTLHQMMEEAVENVLAVRKQGDGMDDVPSMSTPVSSPVGQAMDEGEESEKSPRRHRRRTKFTAERASGDFPAARRNLDFSVSTVMQSLICPYGINVYINK